MGDGTHRGVGIIVGARSRCRRLRRRRQGRGFRRAHPAQRRVADTDRFAIRDSDSDATPNTVAYHDADAASYAHGTSYAHAASYAHAEADSDAYADRDSDTVPVTDGCSERVTAARPDHRGYLVEDRRIPAVRRGHLEAASDLARAALRADLGHGQAC